MSTGLPQTGSAGPWARPGRMWLPSGSVAVNEFLVGWAEGELRRALSRSTLLDGRAFEIFGQGSRVNGTHLDQGSDIDLVLMLTAPVPGYGWEEFRDDVLTVLGESHTVRMGRRCLNVDDPGSLFGEMVDVLVATEHRWSPVPGAGFSEQGVFFRDQDGRAIVNFPRQHRRNGDAKDRRTGGRFKEAVRAAKRARRRGGADLMIDGWLAPSYLIECLLFTIPDRIYRSAGSPAAAYRDALAWLRRMHRDDPVTFGALPCQNGINRLFGPGPDQWDPGAAARIIDVLHQL
ncbi:hypothetical protein [Actinoplanes couchii]|nr:hypothetical protein [Actinoplanes couchii]MDR6317446.1 hypothetical protein [Actinoplanes couchii]